MLELGKVKRKKKKNVLFCDGLLERGISVTNNAQSTTHDKKKRGREEQEGKDNSRMEQTLKLYQLTVPPKCVCKSEYLSDVVYQISPTVKPKSGTRSDISTISFDNCLMTKNCRENKREVVSTQYRPLCCASESVNHLPFDVQQHDCDMACHARPNPMACHIDERRVT